MAENGEKRSPTTHRTPSQDRAYSASPAENKKRAKRKEARKKLGLKKGDPRQADHKKPLRSGGSNAKSNLRITSAKTNAGWKKKDGKK